MTMVLEDQQSTLFDLSGREYNINYVDADQPLFIANNPLHWKGHQLQILISKLQKQAMNNPAQFNSKIYKDAVDELEGIMNAINQEEATDDGVLDQGAVGADRDTGAAQEVGPGTPHGVDSGISPDNPFSR